MSLAQARLKTFRFTDAGADATLYTAPAGCLVQCVGARVLVAMTGTRTFQVLAGAAGPQLMANADIAPTAAAGLRQVLDANTANDAGVLTTAATNIVVDEDAGTSTGAALDVVFFLLITRIDPDSGEV